MRFPQSAFGMGLVGVFSLAALGCRGSATGPGLPLPEGVRFLLDAEPAHALSVLEAKRIVQGDDETLPDTGDNAQHTGESEPSTDVVMAPVDIVLVGRIGTGSEETWDATQAAFLVRDLSLGTEASHHHEAEGHDNCPFCKANEKKALEMSALVQVVDEDGSVVPIDARKLLGLREAQVVVVQGLGELDSLGNLVVSAHGVYLRP